jgi:hypothetical protein
MADDAEVLRATEHQRLLALADEGVDSDRLGVAWLPVSPFAQQSISIKKSNLSASKQMSLSSLIVV